MSLHKPDRTSGAVLDALIATLQSRCAADPEQSYTARLLAAGTPHCVRKFGEEAVETMIAGLSESDERLVEESADLIYHWLALLLSREIDPEAVFACLERRSGGER